MGIFANFFLLINTFKFTSNDDLIIKFNVENSKFKNPEYVIQVKQKLKREMTLLKRKLISSHNNIQNNLNPLKINSKSKRKIPDDIDLDNNVKIYEEQKNMENKGNKNDNTD